MAQYGFMPEGNDVHSHLPTPSFERVDDGLVRFCVVRDPVDRFISAYRDKILNEANFDRSIGEISATDNIDTRSAPSVDDFSLNLCRYMAASSNIMHHFSPQSHFVGHDLGYFSNVFCWENFDSLSNFLYDRTGLVVPHRNHSNVAAVHISDEVRFKIELFYSGDYALLRDYYHPKLL